MNTIVRLSMLILMQADLKKAVEFYQQLGAKLLFHLRDQWAEFDLQGVKLGLCPTSAPVIERRVGAVFEVADVRAFYQEYAPLGCFINEPTEALHGIMVSIKDPGGNVIDIYQPTPERVRAFAQRVGQEKCCGKSAAKTCCRTQN